MKLRSIIVAVIALLTAGTASAQQDQLIPQDPAVRIGHLDNGLTYYIRHNALPEGKADYYIVQQVGSVNEDDDQRGLAHLLEHMAFNGSDHFKNNDMVTYLQTIGVQFGRNLNAATGFDKTIYEITDAPTIRSGAVDSCMLILKDWSNGLTLTQEAINDERDVVHNEYRTGGVDDRTGDRVMPRMFPGSKYGYRLPIGLMSVIDGCNPETLRAYYRKWYRPDNQALVIVGDINVDSIEAKIKTLFGGIKVPADAAKVIPEAVPDNNTAIYIVDKDKERQEDGGEIYLKKDIMPAAEKKTVAYYLQRYTYGVISNMLSARFEELSNEPDCPFLGVGTGYVPYQAVRFKDAFALRFVSKPGKVIESYAAVMTELKRAHDFGFNDTEYQRVKAQWMSNQESYMSNRDKMKNSQFTDAYINNFLMGNPITSVEQRYGIYKQISELPVEVINQMAKELISQSDTNFVTLITMQEKENAVYPTEQELADIVAKVRQTPLTAYVDNVKQEPLISKTPKAGKIKKTEENKALGYKQLTLSNGAKVILKKTDFKNDEIILHGYANGGYLSIPNISRAMSQQINELFSANGCGNFSYSELQKATTGKLVGASISIDPNSHYVNGSSTPKDVETMMQLIYLKMTATNKDENSMKNSLSYAAATARNQANDVNALFMDSLKYVLTDRNKFYTSASAEEIEAIDCDQVVSIAKDMFGDAKDFTFIFVGNYDEATLLPLIKTYLASLPNKNANYTMKEVCKFKGESKCQFNKKMETLQDQYYEIWESDKLPATQRNAILTNIAGQMFQVFITHTVREQLSAAYSPAAGGWYEINADGKTNYNLAGKTGFNPDKTDEAIPYYLKGINELVSAPDAGELQQAQEILVKQHEVEVKNNNYWINAISEYARFGYDGYTGYDETVKSITTKDVSDFVTNVILKSGNHAQILMKAVKE